GLLDNLQFTSPTPTYVFAFRDQESFAPFARATGSENVAGFFNSAGEANYIALNMGAGRAPESIVYHEDVHYLFEENDPLVRRWLNEGLAEYYSTFTVDNGVPSVGKPIESHIRWLRTHRLIPLAELFATTHASRDYHEGDRQGVFYAESWALVHYVLLGSSHKAEMVDFLSRLGRGEPTDTAFRSALGGDYGAVEEELWRYVRQEAFQFVKLRQEGSTAAESLRVA